MEKFPEEIVKCTKCAILKIAKFRENKWNLGPLQRPPQVYSGRVNHSQSTVNISALKSPALLLTWCFQSFQLKIGCTWTPSSPQQLILTHRFMFTAGAWGLWWKSRRCPKACNGTSRERSKKSQNSNFEGEMGQMSGVFFLNIFYGQTFYSHLVF